MNDFLRTCNCVHPAEEDCEKCIDEATVKRTPDAGCEKEALKQEQEAVEKKA